jgi:hypothetical protein
MMERSNDNYINWNYNFIVIIYAILIQSHKNFYDDTNLVQKVTFIFNSLDECYSGKFANIILLNSHKRNFE